MTATKQEKKKKRKRNEIMQTMNFNVLALITVSRKTRKDSVFIHENKKNESISTQITIRFGRISIDSVKVRVNEQQNRSIQDLEKEL